MMNIAYLSIGSNIENRIKNCMLAIDELSAFLIIKKISSFYETEPIGVENQNSFINCAIKIETSLTPRDLLTYLSETEKKLGRNNKGDYKPRAIDLDIICINFQVAVFAIIYFSGSIFSNWLFNRPRIL